MNNEVQSSTFEEIDCIDQYRREKYLNSQLMLLVMATRFGLWLIDDLKFKTVLRETPLEEKDRIKKLVTRLRKNLGDHISELALLYGVWLTNDDVVDHRIEQDVWSGRTLGINPLEEIYHVWQDNETKSFLEERLKRKLGFKRDSLFDKNQFIPLKPWIIRPWLLDREKFNKEGRNEFYEHYPLYEGINWLPQERLRKIRDSLPLFFNQYFPKGAVIFVNLVSALPDAAIIAHWMKHSTRKRRDITLAFYNYSPIIERNRGVDIPSCEEQFLIKAVESGLPVVAVDSFGSSGNTVVKSFNQFVPKIRKIAQDRKLKPVPFYFLLTTGGKFLAEKVLDKLNIGKDNLLGEREPFVLFPQIDTRSNGIAFFGLNSLSP